MGTRFSPFVIGDWVRGERFYGRREQLEEILDGHRKSIWLLGTRRSGKTSMLKELELLTQNEPERGFFPIFWDFQGAENRQGLEESWTEALLDAEERLEARDISVDDFQNESLFSAIGQLRRQLRAMGLKLLALCDEAEELIRLQRSDPMLLRRLRRALQSAPDIHCVLASSIRLWSLSESNEDTSPFLNGFTPPIYLERLSDEAARSLVRQDQMPERIRPNLDDEVVEGILRCCDNQAYLLQLVAKRTVEHGDLDEACARVAADQMVRHFFETDVEMLSDSDRRVLSMLSDESAATSQPYDGRFEEHAMESSIHDSLYRLENLHFIRPDEERRFVLGNYFFRRWMRAVRDSGASSNALKLQTRPEQPPSSSESS